MLFPRGTVRGDSTGILSTGHADSFCVAPVSGRTTQALYASTLKKSTVAQ